MSQSKVFIAFACLALVFVSYVKADEATEPPAPSPAQDSGSESEDIKITDDLLERFKSEVDKEIAKKNITCENYEEACQKEDEERGAPPNQDKENSACRIILKEYLCQGPQNVDTIRRISDKLISIYKNVGSEESSEPAEAPKAEQGNQ